MTSPIGPERLAVQTTGIVCLTVVGLTLLTSTAATAFRAAGILMLAGSVYLLVMAVGAYLRRRPASNAETSDSEPDSEPESDSDSEDWPDGGDSPRSEIH